MDKNEYRSIDWLIDELVSILFDDVCSVWHAEGIISVLRVAILDHSWDDN